MRKLIITLPFLICFILGGCHLYQPDVQQGNIITVPMLERLKPGMSKEQVQNTLGDPILASDFDDNHWAYVYTFQHSGGKLIKRRLDLYFQNNRLVHAQSEGYGIEF